MATQDEQDVIVARAQLACANGDRPAAAAALGRGPRPWSQERITKALDAVELADLATELRRALKAVA